MRLIHTPDAKIETLAECLKLHVSSDVDAIMTDELPAYPKALMLAGHNEAKHFTVNHSHQIWVDGNVTTNGIESAFSLFKRGIVGSFHHVSGKHLHRYLNEFSHRFNRRKMPYQIQRSCFTVRPDFAPDLSGTGRTLGFFAGGFCLRRLPTIDSNLPLSTLPMPRFYA